MSRDDAPRVARGVVVVAALAVVGSCGGDRDAVEADVVLFAEIRSDAARPGAVELTDATGLDELDLGGPGSVQGAAELPDQADGVRRLAWVVVGCAAAGARVTVEDGVATARAVDARDVVCDGSQRYLVVADVPAQDVPAGLVLR